MTLPLAGIRVLEFAEHGFVPSSCAALGDWGADVIKIERLEGDVCRHLLAQGLVADADGYDYLFQSFNRNKRGIALDVTTPDGRTVFERLARWAQVYVTNQLPRVMRKLKTEADDLFAINPTLVVARGHGQGQQGPDAEAGGFDGVSYWARGGVGHMITAPGAEAPAAPRPAMGDAPSGMFLAAGVCAGLVHVLRTGTGIKVDTSLLNGAAWTLQPDLAYTSITGAEPPRGRGGAAPRSPLVNTYRTADERWVGLTMLDEDRYWEPTCRALGLTELAPLSNKDRTPPRPEHHAAMSGAIAAGQAAELVERLRAEGCIFSLIASPVEVIEDPAVVANGYLMEHPTHPPLRLSAAPAQFDDEQLQVRRPAPELGADTDEVLAEIGYSPSDISDLRSRSVVS